MHQVCGFDPGLGMDRRQLIDVSLFLSQVKNKKYPQVRIKQEKQSALSLSIAS